MEDPNPILNNLNFLALIEIKFSYHTRPVFTTWATPSKTHESISLVEDINDVNW